MTVAAQFQQVTQRFGDFTAVDAIDLTIPAGKFTTLLGPIPGQKVDPRLQTAAAPPPAAPAQPPSSPAKPPAAPAK